MIKVKFQTNEDAITYLEVSGHANSNEHGKDLICAAVSSIMFGLMNGLDMLAYDDIKINQGDNQITIINDGSNQEVKHYLALTLIQLKTIEESYKQYIKIIRKEQS